MKNTFKGLLKGIGAAILIVAAALLAVTYLPVTKAQASGLGGSPTQVYSATYHSPGGATNITTGYTNTLTYISVQGTLVTLDLKFGGKSANVSNNITLVVFPAFDTATHATSAAARIQLLPTTTYTEVVTNISNIGAPLVAIQIENPATNPDAITNVVLRVDSSVP